MAAAGSVTLNLSGAGAVARTFTENVAAGQTVADFRERLAKRLDVRPFLMRLRFAKASGAEHQTFGDEDEAAVLCGKTVEVVVADEEDFLSDVFRVLDADGSGFVESQKILVALRTLLSDGEELDMEDLEALEVPAVFKAFGHTHLGARALDREQFDKFLLDENSEGFDDLRALFFQLRSA